MRPYLKIFTIILLLFIISFCNQTPLQPKKKKGIPPVIGLIGYLGVFSYDSKEEGKVVDNKDGTLTYTYTLIQTNGWLGNKILSQRTILIRRCLIGQVYRPTENDCQGTGTKATVWGASQLQWCPTNDRSCEKDGKADPVISPAAKACADDNFAGKTWELMSENDKVATILSYFPNGAIEDMINQSIFRSPIIWLSESIQSDAYPHLALTSNITSNVSSQEKQLFFSVICKGV